jgi:hypothetical protein
MMNVVIINDETTENEFIKTMRKYFKENKSKNNIYCCIDFEFNTYENNNRHISLCQIYYVTMEEKNKDVFIFQYDIISEKMKKYFVKYLLCSRIIKIFHGSDSLDYKHVFDEILFDHKLFTRFINYSIDTRFLCELSNNLMNRINAIQNKKCSLYHALINHNIIDKKLFDYLVENNKKINYNHNWNIHKLSDSHIKYISYDVYYLFELLYEITNRIINENNDVDIISIVNRLYRFHMLNKLKIINVVESFPKVSSEDYEKIYELHICDILYNNHELKITFEDIVDNDTYRKSILTCLKYYYHMGTINEPFDDSFLHGAKTMRGNDTLLFLCKSVYDKALNNNKIKIKCQNKL